MLMDAGEDMFFTLYIFLNELHPRERRCDMHQPLRWTCAT
jgi:hypothetical protein